MGVRRYVRIAAGVAAVAVIGVGAAVTADGGRSGFFERLSSFEEVPALSTTGRGTFRASFNDTGTSLRYRVTFSGLESNLRQSHIHFENETNNGPIIVFLCTNLGNGPAGTQGCPDATSGSFEGTITAADVLAATTQGLPAMAFDEFSRAVRAGATYVNLHTVNFGAGEIRGQID